MLIQCMATMTALVERMNGNGHPPAPEAVREVTLNDFMKQNPDTFSGDSEKDLLDRVEF